MKFGFVLTNLAGGGAEKAILKLGSALTRHGNEVHMILLEHRVEHGAPTDVRLHALTAPGNAISKGILGRRFAAWRLRRLLAQLAGPKQFDLVVSTLPFADEVTIRANVGRHWCRIANTLSAEVERLRAADRRKSERRLTRYRQMYGRRPLIAVSDGVAADLRDLLHPDKVRIERIYNLFDFADLRALAAAPAALPERPYVIHVGRFAAQKRHDLLLDAWSRLDVAHRLVLLTQPDPRLARLIAERGLSRRVIVAGFQSNPYPWIAAADLLVLSSDYEGLPNVIIEALALGTPVVSTDCRSGPREILGSALQRCLVPVGNAQALADAVGRAIAEPPDIASVDLSPYAVDAVVAAYERIAAEQLPNHE